MGNINKTDAVLLGVLCELNREVLRTKFVKLVYLLDNFYFEQLGETLTDFTYHWDHYGPNTVGNAITESLAKLSKHELVRDTQKLTPYEDFANYYKCADSVNIEDIPLDDKDWSFIHSIVKRFGHMSREEIVRESKRTAPMQGVSQKKEILIFRQNPKIEVLKKKFYDDSKFVRDTMEALKGWEAPIELGELREQVAQRT